MTSPSFIIAGERRSGTSTLAKWIEVHPEVFLSPQLDQAFFVDDALRGRRSWLEGHVDPGEWYKTHNQVKYEEAFSGIDKEFKAIGEKSADYFFWEPCLERILSLYPNIKIILTFRHPVERAWSHYWNEVGKKRENLSFEAAIQAEESRILQSDYAKVHLSYVARGKYIDNLKRWLTKVNKENVHIVILEELIKNPTQELIKVYNFLGVDETKGLERAGMRFNNNWTTIPKSFWTKNALLQRIEEKINRFIKRYVKYRYKDIYQRRRMSPKWESITRVPQKSIKMKEETRNKLIERFEDSTLELESLLNKNLKTWRQ